MRKQLAIKGHETRGNEVIEILEMLGGNNKFNFKGYDNKWYVLDDGEILYANFLFDEHGFTLEEFLEKFPFKINDIVVNDNYSCTGIITEMRWDSDDCEVKYCVDFENLDTIVWFNHNEIKSNKDELFHEGNKEPLHELCEKLCNNKLSMLMIDSEVCDDEVEIILNDYEIEVRDGKTYAIKKKSKYPTTYEECCGVLGMTFDYPDIRMVSNDEYNLYSSFIQLIRCRDAYWKIEDFKYDVNLVEDYFYIVNKRGCIIKDCCMSFNHILAFPTREMRDAFYKNFNDLIEECKNLL